MTYGDSNTQPDTVIVDMDESQADASLPHADDAVLPEIPPEHPENLGLPDELLALGGAWTLKRPRSVTPDNAAIYQSLPTSPKVPVTSHSEAMESDLSAQGVSFLAPEVEDFDAGLATGSIDEGYQRSHSQPFTFQHDEESDLGPPAKKRRLFQHEHLLDTAGQEELVDIHLGADHDLDHHPTNDEESQQHDDITAQLMASLQQAAEDTEFAGEEGQQPDLDLETGTVDAEQLNLEGDPEVPQEQGQEQTDPPEQLDVTLQAQSELHDQEHQQHQEQPVHQEQPEHQDFQTHMDFSHDDLLDAFIGASAAASPIPPDNQEHHTEQEHQTEHQPAPSQDDVAQAAPTASPPKESIASPMITQPSPSPIVIDPALARMGPNPVRSSHPLSAAPVPVIPVRVPSNSRPVATNPLSALNGPSRSSSAGLTSHSPSTTGPRPVVLAPNHHRPLPKKPTRDYTPARPTDKRRPTPRRGGGRDPMSDPYQPPLASTLGYQTNVVVKNNSARPGGNVDDANLAASLSPETLAVLEAAATTLSQIQGPITQEHLEGIVLQLTNAGIDLAQLGLGGLLAQEEDEDTPLQDVNNMNGDLTSTATDFASQGFGDTGMDSQPDDMNLQAQSLIAALSALVPQSQGPTDQGSRTQGQGSADAPITIDLTDDPDDEPMPTPEPKKKEPVSTGKDEKTSSPTSGSKDVAKSPEHLQIPEGKSPVSAPTSDLDQEKARILGLDRQARIELLKKLVQELEQEPAKAPEPDADHPDTDGPDQNGATKEDGESEPLKDTATTEDTATVADGAKQSIEDDSTTRIKSRTPPQEGPMSEDLKQKPERLALYRDLLTLTQTESTKADSPAQPENSNTIVSGTPKPVSPGPPEPVSSIADVSSGDPEPNSADEPDVPSVNDDSAIDATVASGADQNNGDRARKFPTPDAPPPTDTTEQPTNNAEQGPQVVEEPIVVKAEPVDIDITAMINAVGAEAMQSGDAETAAPGATSEQQDDTHASHPGDISMEEDPLLAELFPTFPMGNSPMQAHQTQTQEEADPLLAGMLQELDASNGHDGMTYDGLGHEDNFSAGWNPWAEVPHVIPETIVQVASAFDMDPDPHKMNLGLIGFREDSGRIFVPPTTRQTERQLYGRGGPQHDALPIEGFGPFLQAGVRMAYGSDSKPYREARIAAIQAVSITGALRLGGTFLARFPLHMGMKSVFVPNPTAGEDARALHESGLDVKLYRFFDRANGGVDFPGMCEDLAQAPEQSIVVLHVSGSSPTGASLVISQWRTLIDIIKAGRHIPFLVMEFQGLASGDPNIDAHPVRYMTQEGIPFMLAQSFDSAMGLYIDSPSIVSVVTNSHQEKLRIESQMRHVARTLHSHPGPLGAHIAAGILNDSQMYRSWLKEIKAMSDRLRSIREKLYDYLTHKLRTPGVWTHFRGSRGMYSAVLLDPMQIRTLATREHIHLLPDGCFSLGCLNAAKIELLARAIDRVVRHPEIVSMEMEPGSYMAGDEGETTLHLEMTLHESFPGYE